MTAEGLNVVLEAGRAERTAYYDRRARDFDAEHQQGFAKLFIDVPSGGRSIAGSAIRAVLTQEYGPDEAKKSFRRALHCGILSKHAESYAAPVPSMHDWLASNHASEQIKFPHESPRTPNLDDRSASIDFDR